MKAIEKYLERYAMQQQLPESGTFNFLEVFLSESFADLLFIISLLCHKAEFLSLPRRSVLVMILAKCVVWRVVCGIVLSF